jgi:hypothetical protein
MSKGNLPPAQRWREDAVGISTGSQKFSPEDTKSAGGVKLLDFFLIKTHAAFVSYREGEAINFLFTKI